MNDETLARELAREAFNAAIHALGGKGHDPHGRKLFHAELARQLVQRGIVLEATST